MDSRPDELRNQIASTRAALDYHLDELGTQIDVTKDRVKTQAQFWAGISAVVAGVLGTIAFWPRRVVRRRRVAQPFRGAVA